MSAPIIKLNLTLSFQLDPKHFETLAKLAEGSASEKFKDSLIACIEQGEVTSDGLEISPSPSDSRITPVGEPDDWLHYYDFFRDVSDRELSTRSLAMNKLGLAIYSSQGDTAGPYGQILHTVRISGTYRAWSIHRQDLIKVLEDQSNQEVLVKKIEYFGPKCLRTLCGYLGVEYKLKK